MGVERFKYMLTLLTILSLRASAEITTIYAVAGMPMVLLPCFILKGPGTAINPEFESMWAFHNSSVYLLVIISDKQGTTETFRQPILGEDTIYANSSYKNEQFFGRVNVSASHGLIIYNVKLSDAGKFLCRYRDTEVYGAWKVELIVFNVTSPNPTSNEKSSGPPEDNLNTEWSRDCILWKALLGGILGFIGAVWLFTKRNKVWGWIKLCLSITSQNGDGTLELRTAHNIKGHDAQSVDTSTGGSQVESEGTNGFDCDREDIVDSL